MTTDHPAQILLLEGADATAFAQAQFSSNVQSLGVGRWQFGAWLDAQGRVLTLFHLARLADDTLLLLLRGGDAAAMAQSLQRFAFRSKVKLSVPEPRSLGAGPAVETYAVHREGDAYVFGCGDHSMTVGTTQPDDAWRLPQVRMGWPWLPHDVPGKLLPQSLSLERLEAVAFDKGCYPGQEIVARLHYRGGLKRHMHCVVLSQHVTEGTVLHRNGENGIQLLDVVTDDATVIALAVIDDGLVSAIENTSDLDTDEGVSLRVTESWPA
ncbi:YgfZ/GcvT domain-containing protein [Dyella japonica]|uniref:Folate-binding protein n=1 Tax=Dyella japonica A8 TaxID=1217721 RepID=A0A075K1V6_9GAMM|nr:folate-binding protein YgfZ [Dyella japonica]AIF47697.1 folate-binding protein [Dyella japonica A8]